MGKLVLLSVEFIKPLHRTNPEGTCSIFKAGYNHIVAQAPGISGVLPVVGKALCNRIEFAQPVSGRANPDHPLPVLKMGAATLLLRLFGSAGSF